MGRALIPCRNASVRIPPLLLRLKGVLAAKPSLVETGAGGARRRNTGTAPKSRLPAHLVLSQARLATGRALQDTHCKHLWATGQQNLNLVQRVEEENRSDQRGPRRLRSCPLARGGAGSAVLGRRGETFW